MLHSAIEPQELWGRFLWEYFFYRSCSAVKTERPILGANNLVKAEGVFSLLRTKLLTGKPVFFQFLLMQVPPKSIIIWFDHVCSSVPNLPFVPSLSPKPGKVLSN